MDARKIALISIMSALAVAIGYSGLLLSFLPGLIEFLTIIVFINGYCFGPVIGGTIGALSMTIKMLVPHPFAHPAAWIFTISPILLVVVAALGALYGIIGGFLGKKWNPNEEKRRLILKIAAAGFVITFIYDILSSVGFYIAYPLGYSSIWEALYLTFIPLYYQPYPPIIHVFTNTIVFALLGPPLIIAIKKLGSSL